MASTVGSGWRRPWRRRGSSMSAKKSGSERMVSAEIMAFGPPCRSSGRSSGRGAVAAAGAAEAARAADAGPVRGAVHRAVVARRVDERLQEQQRMAEARRPVRRQAALAQRQRPRAQVRRPRPRQDQEAAVVRDQMQPAVLDAEVPADPAVPRPALERRRREAEQRQPLAAPVRRVPQRLADLRQRPQEVVRRHQLPVASLVTRRHRLDLDLAQIQRRLRPRQLRARFYTSRPPMFSVGTNPLFSIAFPRRTNPPCCSGRSAWRSTPR